MNDEKKNGRPQDFVVDKAIAIKRKKKIKIKDWFRH
jgi:hypothetical protein